MLLWLAPTFQSSGPALDSYNNVDDDDDDDNNNNNSNSNSNSNNNNNLITSRALFTFTDQQRFTT